MRRLSPQTRFRLIAYGIPIGLILFWAGADSMDLIRNYWKIHKLNQAILKLEKTKLEFSEELDRLKKNDSALYEKILRTEFHALKPNEIEYRFPTNQ